MRTTTMAAMAVSVLALAACHPRELKHSDFAKFDMSASSSDSDTDSDKGPPLKAVSTLDCPLSEGALNRTAQGADGKSCDYTGPGSQTVHLSLVALDGRSVLDTFAPMKAELKTLVPAIPPGPVGVEASKDEGGDHAKVDMPFLHVDAHGNKAKVNLFGFQIDADDDKNTATVKGNMPGMKNTVVHAGPGGAEVLAENVGVTNASMVYVLASDKAGPDGDHAVGYIAKGPASGPMVVGEFRSKGERHGNDEHHDLDRLIDRNVKG